MVLPAAEDHAIDRMLVQQVHQIRQGSGIEIQLGQNVDFLLGLGLEFLAHAGGFLRGAHQDEPAPQLRARKASGKS